MNKLKILFFLFLLPLAACNRSGKGLSTDIVQNGKHPKITFEETSHDFGTINEGEVVSYTFDFTNTGDGDLLISDAHGQCSCTVPEWPKEPIKPGGKGEVRVKFDSTGKSGIATKDVTIVANTDPNTSKIRITANIHRTS